MAWPRQGWHASVFA